MGLHANFFVCSFDLPVDSFDWFDLPDLSDRYIDTIAFKEVISMGSLPTVICCFAEHKRAGLDGSISKTGLR